MVKKLDVIPVLVCVLHLPQFFWSRDVFWETCNNLGIFSKVATLHMEMGYMGMAHIVVALNISNGLVDEISISKDNQVFRQAINYKGIPLKCGKSHV